MGEGERAKEVQKKGEAKREKGGEERKRREGKGGFGRERDKKGRYCLTKH